MEIKKRKLSRFFDEEEDSLRAPSLVPMDCLLLIFSYLRSEDLVNLRSVCKEFEIAFSNTLLSYPYLTLFKILKKIEDNYCGKTKDLDSKSSHSRNIRTVNRLREVAKSFLAVSETFKYVTTMENLITTNTKYERNKKEFFHSLVSKITSTVITKKSYKNDDDILIKELLMNDINDGDEITLEFGDSCTLKFFYDFEGIEEISGIILTFPAKKNTRFLKLYPRLFDDLRQTDFSDGERIQVGVRMKEFFGAVKLIKTRRLVSKDKDLEDEHRKSGSWGSRKKDDDRDWCFSRNSKSYSPFQIEQELYQEINDDEMNEKNETKTKRNDEEKNEIFQNEVMLLFYNILFFGSKYGGFANRFYESQKFDVFRDFFLTLHRFKRPHKPASNENDEMYFMPQHYNLNDLNLIDDDDDTLIDLDLLVPPQDEVEEELDAVLGSVKFE